MKKEKVLSVNNLSVSISKGNKFIKLLDDISFDVLKNQIVGIVGETGSGKTLTMLTIMNMLPKNIKVMSGEIFFMNENLFDKSNEEWKQIRQKDLTMIFQYQKLLLSPIYKISTQMRDIIKTHKNLSNKKLDIFCLDLLKKVGFSEPKEVFEKYPFEISGGMQQQVMLAIIMSMSPKLLIADEPTTALDADVQNNILSIISKFQKELKNSLIIITHDFSVIKTICTHVIIIKDGKIVEQNTVENILKNPQNEYTKKLVNLNKWYI